MLVAYRPVKLVPVDTGRDCICQISGQMTWVRKFACRLGHWTSLRPSGADGQYYRPLDNIIALGQTRVSFKGLQLCFSVHTYLRGSWPSAPLRGYLIAPSHRGARQTWWSSSNPPFFA